MNTTQPQQIIQRWHVIQHELLPELKEQEGPLTPKLEQVVHTLEWVRIEEFTGRSWIGVGRPPFERAWLANAFVAKAVLGVATAVGLLERLMIDRALRRICGYPRHKTLPSEATFSRAFEEFAESGLGQRVHEALIKEHLGDPLIGHLNRGGTAIEAREHPARKETPAVEAAATAPSALLPAEESPAETSVPETPAPARKRGHPRRGEARPAAKASRSSANADRRWRKCSIKFLPPVITARSAMPKATRTVGMATNYISTPPTVASRLRHGSPAPRCTTAWLPYPCR